MAVTVDVGPTIRLVEEKFDTSASFANDLWDVAKDYLEELQGGDYSFSLAGIDTSIDDINTDVEDPVPPGEFDDELTLPGTPPDAILREVTIDSVDVPSFDVVAPVITYPDSPDPTWPAELGEPPSITEPTIPSKPSYNLPTVPNITDIVIPDLPIVVMPEFEGTLPIDDVDPPQSIFVYNEADYQSSLQDMVNTKLLDSVENGGTGLSVTVEDGMWSRALSRKQVGDLAKHEEAERYFSSRGFSIPQGALDSKLTELLTERARAEDDLNKDIATEQAKLAQTNTHFAITSAIQNEASVMAYLGSKAERVLNTAKYTQETAIAIFNAMTAKYNLKLATYQTCAAVYESKIKAAGLILEQYRVKLEGIKIVADIQKLYVDIYTAQVGAVQTLIELYRVEMDTARIQAEMERLKLEGFGEKVKVYTARVNAITSNYNAYQAAVAGEAAKASVYTEQVRAHVGKVEAGKIESSINIAEANAEVEYNRSKIEELRAKIEQYNAEVAANVAEIETAGKVHGYDVERYKADISKASSQLAANLGKYSAESLHSSNVARVKIEQSRLFRESVDRVHQLDFERAKASAAIAAQMAASALSAVAAGAQISYRASLGGEVSESYNHNLNV